MADGTKTKSILEAKGVPSAPIEWHLPPRAPAVRVLPPEVYHYPSPKIPTPGVWLGMVRFFRALPVAIIPGDSAIHEPERMTPPKWRLGDLDPATHLRLEAERRDRVIQWLASEQVMAWTRGDFLRVQQLQNAIQHLHQISHPFSGPIRILRLQNSSGGNGQRTGTVATSKIDPEKLRQLAERYGILPQGIVADFLQAAVDGSPIVPAMLLRLSALGDQAGPLWPENAHLNILKFLVDHAKDEAAKVYAIAHIVRDIEARTQNYRDYIRGGHGLDEGLRAQLDAVRESVAFLVVITQGRNSTVRQKAEEALHHLAFDAREDAISRLLSNLIQNPQQATSIVKALQYPAKRAASTLRDIHRELLHQEPPPVDLPSDIDETVSPHHTTFSPPGDAEATLSLFWPAPFDQPALWDRLLRQWGDSDLIPKYYEPGAILEPLLIFSEPKTRYPLDPWEVAGSTWNYQISGGEPLQQLYDKVMVADDVEYKKYAAAHLIRESRRQPWPSQLLALSQIAIRNPSLSQNIVMALRQILMDCTVADHYRPSLAPGAAEAAFDGLMRIATASDHFHSAVARRALMEVARHSPRVARRLKKVQWGKSGPLAVLRSSNPP